MLDTNTKNPRVQRNILLLQIISPLKSAWIWLGIWVLYYLNFTNNAGIGIMETVILVLSVTLEIPTGVLADIIGKRKTIILSLIFAVAGYVVMSSATSLTHLIISGVVWSFDTALFSGTADAILYDSLKQVKREDEFDKYISRIRVFSLITMAVCSLIGGFMYSYNIRAPFIATGIIYLLSLILSLFLVEPQIDSLKYKFKESLQLVKISIKELTSSKINRSALATILLLGSFVHIFTEYLDFAILNDQGFSEKALGAIYAVAPIITALGISLITRNQIENKNKSFLILITLTLTILFTSVNQISGLIFLFTRNFFYGVPEILASIEINKNINANIRTTALSTYNMLMKSPYLITAFFIGMMIDNISAIHTAKYLAIIYLTFGVLWFIFDKIRTKHYPK